MRHANSNITMNIHTHAVSSKKRRAQSKVVEMTLPEQSQPAASAGIAQSVFSCVSRRFSKSRLTLLERMAVTTGLEPAASAVTAQRD
jgi:hypothetical protein